MEVADSKSGMESRQLRQDEAVFSNDDVLQLFFNASMTVFVVTDKRQAWMGYQPVSPLVCHADVYTVR